MDKKPYRLRAFYAVLFKIRLHVRGQLRANLLRLETKAVERCRF